MIAIPPAFVAEIESREGMAGSRWLETLPGLVAAACARWMLSIDGPPTHGSLAMVIPVHRQHRSYVLKISWQNADTVHEAIGLRAWAGRGTVRLFASAPEDGTMVLERLDAERSLKSLSLAQALPIVGSLIRELAITSPVSLPATNDLAHQFAATAWERWSRTAARIPRRFISHAIDCATDLSRGHPTTMVNWDLHSGNVLFSSDRQRWVATDPKPAIGPLESTIAPFLWTRVTDITGSREFHRHLRTLIDVAGLDTNQTRAWLQVRLVDFWLWELSVGLDHDPGGCGTMLAWLESRSPDSMA
jgi:streptomycin 6-kinase